MLFTYFRFALKNIVAHKLFPAINIGGLAIGLACCLTIGLYIRDELSFDEHYRNADRIIRVDQIVGGMDNYRTPGLLASTIEQEMAGIDSAARFVYAEAPLAVDDYAFNEDGFAYADQRFLDIFDFQWLRGDPTQALSAPASIVLTESLATKYFPDTNPMGKIMRSGAYALQVTGVIKDLPGNTHLRFTALAPMALFAEGLRGIGFSLEDWRNWFVSTYVLMKEGVDVEEIRAQLPAIAARHLQQGTSLTATRVTNLYMHAPAHMERAPIGSMARVLTFGAVAICILIIAVINFTNLTTARSSVRALEVGLRKSVGAGRADLIKQFLGECFILVISSMVLALVLIEVLLPLVNAVTGKTLVLELWSEPTGVGFLLLFSLALALMAGFYPAFYLSAIKPSTTLKGGSKSGGRRSSFHSALVVVQFSIAIALIVTAVAIYMQIHFTRDIDMGFNGEQVVVLDLPFTDTFDVNVQWQAFRSQLQSAPGIIASTHSVSTPLMEGANPSASIYRQDQEDRVRSQQRLPLQAVDPAYMAVYGLQLVSGRWFSQSLASDRLVTFSPGYSGEPRGGLVLNERAARLLGWSPAEALGQVLGIGTLNTGTVIGIVGNTMTNARREYQPLVYYVPESFEYRFGATIAVRISAGAQQQALDQIDTTWKTFLPNRPIQRYFLEERLQALYQQDWQQLQLALLSAALAVLIACFGLYGLAAFNAARRVREIGIRKVMGGSVWSIVLLLTNDFSKLVLLANLIAWPVAYFAVNRWLENFAYRIDLTPMIFIGSGLTALCIAWVTVGATATRAARARPVLALRYE